MIGANCSVVIATYNRAGCLRRALESIVAQTCHPLEVLVCDDGSTDDTGEVAREFANRLAIDYSWREHWGGPAGPRNAGIQKARGEWVCFLDSDDWWYPRKLEHCLPFLAEHDVVYHDLEIASAQGMTGRLIGRDLTSPFSVDLLTNLNGIPNSAALVRCELLHEVGGLSEDKGIVGAEDFDLWLRISRRTERFHRVPEALGAYLEMGPGHNLSASDGQIQREQKVFERYRSSLSDSDLRIAERHWTLRQRAMENASI